MRFKGLEVFVHDARQEEEQREGERGGEGRDEGAGEGAQMHEAKCKSWEAEEAEKGEDKGEETEEPRRSLWSLTSM